MKNLLDNHQDNQQSKSDVYIAPEIEVIEVEIEQGFQGSDPFREIPSW